MDILLNEKDLVAHVCELIGGTFEKKLYRLNPLKIEFRDDGSRVLVDLKLGMRKKGGVYELQITPSSKDSWARECQNYTISLLWGNQRFMNKFSKRMLEFRYRNVDFEKSVRITEIEDNGPIKNVLESLVEGSILLLNEGLKEESPLKIIYDVEGHKYVEELSFYQLGHMNTPHQRIELIKHSLRISRGGLTLISSGSGYTCIPKDCESELFPPVEKAGQTSLLQLDL